MTEEANLFEGAEDVQPADPDEPLIKAIIGDEDEEIDEESIDDEEKEPEPPPKLYKLKIDGQEVEVTEDELKAGYSTNAASTKRWQEAAELRKEAEAQREVYTRNAQQMGQAIQQLNQQIQQWQQEGEPDWQDLLENNPHEYLKQQEIRKQRMVAIQQAQQAQYMLHEQQQLQQAEAVKQHMAVETKSLLDDGYLPEWKDSKVRESEEKELIEYLKNEGYTDQDIAGLNYSRAKNIKIAVNAMRYQKLLEKAKKAKAKSPAEAPSPVPTVTGKAKSIKTPESMSDAEFARWRRSFRER